MKMTDERKRYLKEYRETELKRIPLELRFRPYVDLCAHVVLCEKHSINGFIKDAIRLKCELMDLGMLEDVERDIRVKKGLSAIGKGDDE